MAIEISAASPDESLLFYSNEEKDKEFGCIGHLRGDFGQWDLNVYGFRAQCGQYQFYVRCFPHQGDYNFYIYCYNNVKQRIHEKGNDDKMPSSPKKKKDQPER